ncbi:MAG TPA: threonine-phosphate decarboxylase CobD [Nitrospirota bacterium]|nr:threonine-phosphate decarboxylase CobD [Nitrospirota bacterium]
MQNTHVVAPDSLPRAVRSGEQRPHGGNIRSAARQYGLSERDIIDFSSNVNPLGPSPAALKETKRSLSLLGRYPDPDAADLRMAVAGHFGIQPEEIVCGNGSNGLIHLIPRTFRPKKVLIPVPTFTEYAAAVEAAGGEVVPLQLAEHGGFRIDPVEMAFALKGVDMAFLCNPNNPTGRLIPRAEMHEIIRYALEAGVRLVIDETFMDFIEPDSLLKEVAHTSHCICLRTFAKFFGMPGLRIGYAVAGMENAAVLRGSLEPWAVNVLAERAAVAALNDWKYIKRTREMVEREREHLLGELRLLPGVETYPAFANFLLLKLTGVNGPALCDKLALRGILVRDCSSFPGMGNRHIRIAVRNRKENNRLVQALRELLIR